MSGRYDAHPGESEILSNKLGITDQEVINEEEAAGFLKGEHDAIDELAPDTEFSLDYLYTLHQKALGNLYDFAGKLRTVNMSKGGFMFAPAEFLPQTINDFADEWLQPLNIHEWSDRESLLNHLARLHAELLYIHPFREGNGRLVRLFTKLIFLAKTGEEINFESIVEGGGFNRYITAVQQASKKEYSLMEKLFREMCPRLN